MNKPILFLLGLLFVVSCTEQNDEPTHQAKQPEVQYNSPTRTPQEAQNEVADVLTAMDKKTRKARNRQSRNLSKVFYTNNPANQPSTISPPPVRSNVPYYYQYNLQYSIIYTTK